MTEQERQVPICASVFCVDHLRPAAKEAGVVIRTAIAGVYTSSVTAFRIGWSTRRRTRKLSRESWGTHGFRRRSICIRTRALTRWSRLRRNFLTPWASKRRPWA